jgi:hypothetical protein
MSVTDPEAYRAFISQGATSPELKKPLVISEDTSESNLLNRYCSDDGSCGHSNDAGCRRTETMIKWEEENDQLLPANLVWGARDQFFFFEDKIFYYKPYLEKILAEDANNLNEDNTNPEFVKFLNDMQSLAPDYKASELNSLADIIELVKLGVPGIPKFINETLSFLIFESPGDTLVTEITRDVLDAVNATFTSNYRFCSFTPADALYIKNGVAYWTDLTRVVSINSNSLKQGVSLNGKFYPFGTLSADALTVINLAGNSFAKDYSVPFSIVTL